MRWASGIWLGILWLALTTLGLPGCGGGNSGGDVQARLAEMKRLRALEEEKERQQAAGGNAAPSVDNQPRVSRNTVAPPKEMPSAGPILDPKQATQANGLQDVFGSQPELEAASKAEAQTAQSRGPKPPKTLEERRERAVQNMEKIAAALTMYAGQKGTFPTQALVDGNKRPLLSWRVEILPQLGYEALYKKFKLDEAWDSPHNRALLAEMPWEYQSPERLNETTNYLVPAGTSVIQAARGLSPRRVDDGLPNTLMLLEVDDSLAMPWTAPRDYEPDRSGAPRDLGGLRDGGFLAASADGRVMMLPADINPKHFRAAFSIDGGDDAGLDRFGRDPRTPPDALNTELAGAPEESNENGSPLDPLIERVAAPDEKERSKALEKIKEIYLPEYSKATSAAERTELALRMLDDGERFAKDPAGRFALYHTAVTVLAREGDLPEAMNAAETVIAHFEIDPYEYKSELLEQILKGVTTAKQCGEVVTLCDTLIDQAVAAGQFDQARKLADLNLRIARKSGLRTLVTSATARGKEIKDAEAHQTDLTKARFALDINPKDTAANCVVGRDLCLFHGQWNKGLPLLVRGQDPEWSALAERDLAAPNDAAAKLQLGLDYWVAARPSSRGAQVWIRGRAAYWFATALAQANPSGVSSFDWERTTELLREAAKLSPTAAQGPGSQAGLLIQKAGQQTSDPAAQFALLLWAIDAALDNGDAPQAVQALSIVTDSYNVGLLALQTDVLAKVAGLPSLNAKSAETAFAISTRLIDEAILRNDFERGRRLYGIAAAIGRRTNDRDKLLVFSQRENEVEAAEQFWASVQEAIPQLVNNPNDPAANQTVGRYYCLVRRDWKKGLPMLAKASDPRLKLLAEQEAVAPVDALNQMKLAQGWWTLGEELPGVEQKAARLRALRWYQLAAPRLDDNRSRTQIRQRVELAREMYGREIVEQIEKEAAREAAGMPVVPF